MKITPKNSDLKRDAIKLIRDKAKHAYNKTGICEICTSTTGVDFHHYYSMTEMLEKYVKDHSISLTCTEDVLAIREEFIAIHNDEIYNETANLCHRCHEQLHRLYGKRPALNTALKQKRWVQIQKDKYGTKRLDN